jgi:hypothetical protein
VLLQNEPPAGSAGAFPPRIGPVRKSFLANIVVASVTAALDRLVNAWLSLIGRWLPGREAKRDLHEAPTRPKTDYINQKRAAIHFQITGSGQNTPM